MPRGSFTAPKRCSHDSRPRELLRESRSDGHGAQVSKPLPRLRPQRADNVGDDKNPDNTNWDAVDSDWVAENRPDKLTAVHRERLIMKHGPRAGNEKFIAAVQSGLRKVRIGPPYRGGR